MTSDSTLRQDVYSAVRTLINTDKSSYGASATPALIGGYPDLSTITFPCIAFPNVNIGKSESTFGTSMKSTISVMFILFAKKNEDLDKMSDGIDNSITTNTWSGFTLVDSSEDDAFITPNDQKIKSKTLSYTFIRR